MVERYKRKPNSACIVCHTQIYRRPCDLKKSNGRAYCSSACFGLSCRNEKPCVVCGKGILSSLHKKTCSRSCANTHRAGLTYKTGRKKDNAHNQKALRVTLLSERGSTCERCSYSNTKILQVHHKDRDRKNNSRGNLELLCPNCHYEEHLVRHT